MTYYVPVSLNFIARHVNHYKMVCYRAMHFSANRGYEIAYRLSVCL